MAEKTVTISLEEFDELRAFKEKMHKGCIEVTYRDSFYRIVSLKTKDEVILGLKDSIDEVSEIVRRERVENDRLADLGRKLASDIKKQEKAIDSLKANVDLDKRFIAIKTILIKKGFWNKLKVCCNIMFSNGEINNLINSK